MDVDDFSFGFDPFVGAAEAAVGFDGAKYGVSRNGLFGASLKDAFENGADVVAALFDEAEGFHVAVEGAVVDVVMSCDAGEFDPVLEFLFHLFAVGMAADLALSGVAFEVRRKSFVFSVGAVGDQGRRRERTALLGQFVHDETSKTSLT
ncbi:MAG TPA: hypothetical protein VMB47_10545 [Candidatus Aquilonibacter sp.]|nr:hypothetical protein [Candidatus Aquilonibacter sp.]